MIILGLLENA